MSTSLLWDLLSQVGVYGMAMTSTITAGFSPIGEDFLLVNDFDGNAIAGPQGLQGDCMATVLSCADCELSLPSPTTNTAGLIAELGSGGLISGVRLEDAIVAGSPMNISHTECCDGRLGGFSRWW